MAGDRLDRTIVNLVLQEWLVRKVAVTCWVGRPLVRAVIVERMSEHIVSLAKNLITDCYSIRSRAADPYEC
jgi:hypothetical protein